MQQRTISSMFFLVGGNSLWTPIKGHAVVWDSQSEWRGAILVYTLKPSFFSLSDPRNHSILLHHESTAESHAQLGVLD